MMLTWPCRCTSHSRPCLQPRSAPGQGSQWQHRCSSAAVRGEEEEEEEEEKEEEKEEEEEKGRSSHLCPTGERTETYQHNI